MPRIGPYKLCSQTILAPMAGVADLPFRRLCRKFGAGMAFAEMVTADSRLWHRDKSRQRLIDRNEDVPRAVQIVGSEPDMLAQAARRQVILGAQIVDINMGCPAKKVCRKAAGSALLKDEKLVREILDRVVNAVDVPVTLKIRTGWNPQQRNGVTIARIAEDAGIAALSVHGRTRACRFSGNAEHDTTAAIVDAVDIPVIANGDIDSPNGARRVLEYTGASAVMIGRAALGRPWLFREINHFLENGEELPPPDAEELRSLLLEHVAGLHAFYGEQTGVRFARKHVGWYLDLLSGEGKSIKCFNGLDNPQQQLYFLQSLFDKPVHLRKKAA